MAAACDASEGTENSINAIIQYHEELSETQMVAQAITELQEIVHGDTVLLQNHDPIPDALPPDLNQAEIMPNIEDLGEITMLPDGTSTQVIYLIKEDGQIEEQRIEERVLVDSSVQANDYEIERRSGRLPARKRIIPAKFRDYRDASDKSGSDDEYIPEARPKVKARKTVNSDIEIIKRPVGRPRKHPLILDSQNQSDNQHNGSQPAANVPADGNQYTGSGEDAGTQSTAYNNDGVCVGEPVTEPIQEDAQTTGADTEGTQFDDVCTSVKQEVTGVEDDDWRPEEHRLTGTVKRRPGRPRGPNWEKSYVCPTCSKRFSQKGNLKVHLRIHNNLKPFPCQEMGCSKTFRSNESLRKHILSHKGIKPYECHHCGNKFSSLVGLQEHISRHDDLKPYKCTICDRHFRQVSCLRRHVITHGNDTPYSCETCSKQFSQPQYLRSHLRVHTGEKPFGCDICGKRFAYQSDVKRHKITHTGDKPFGCEICGSRFSDSSSRRRHEREHVNRKPYLCQLCNETFKRAGQLKAHLTRRHVDIRIAESFTLKTLKGDINEGAILVLNEAEENTTQDPNMPQQRIVELIKSLHDKAVAETESQSASRAKQETIAEKFSILRDHVTKETEHVMDISPVVGEVESVVLESSAVPLELQATEISESEETGPAYIALADFAASLEKEKLDGTMQYRYQVIQEVNENGEPQQILIQIPEDSVSNHHQITQVEEITDTVDAVMEAISGIPHENITITSEENIEQTNTQEVGKKENYTTPTATASDKDASSAASMHYVNNPDFTSQAYYNWLSNFTELCKVVPMPLEVSLFQKISQVHKTLSDVMATPSGVVADKENFRVLMNISRELSTIINEHLLYVLENQTQ